MKKVSIVVPVYNEEIIVEQLISRIQRSIDGLRYHFEILFIDDGSSDNTLRNLLKIQENENRIKIIKLSRNWGHQNAYNAGLDYASGNGVVFMDGDLEDPPEIIRTFLEKWEEGYEVVSAIKKSRYESRIKKMMFSFFYSIINFFSGVTIDKHSGMFSLIDEKVVRELRRCREKNKYYVGLRSFLGFKQTRIFYHREKRFAGKPKQSFRKLIKYAIDALFSFSFVPIRIIGAIGFCVMVIIVLLSIGLIILRVLHLKIWIFGQLPYGWTSLIMLNLFTFGVMSFFIGVVGEYIARVFEEVRNRPYFVVDEIFESKEELTKKCREKNEKPSNNC